MAADQGPDSGVSGQSATGGRSEALQFRHWHNVFQVIGDAFSAQVGIEETLTAAARALVVEFGLKGCQFRLRSRDQQILEHVASYGLSDAFLNKGPVDAERSMTEALEGRVVAVLNCASDPRIQYPEAHAQEGIISVLTVPLAARGQVIGVMRLSAGERREFSSDEVAYFKVVALFCASAVTRAMFHRILEHVTDSIRTSLDLDEVLGSIVKVVTEDLRTKGCTIRLLDDKGERLELRAACGLGARYLETASAEPGKGVWKALEDGECVSIQDPGHDPLIRHHAEVTEERIGSMLFVPLMVRDAAIGVLSVYTHRRYSFSEDEIQLMEAIGEQCALAIRNAQMYAAIKHRYQSVVDEFHQWFEHCYTHSTGSGTEPRSR